MLLPSYIWKVIWRGKIRRQVGKDGVSMNETDKKWVHVRASECACYDKQESIKISFNISWYYVSCI